MVMGGLDRRGRRAWACLRRPARLWRWACCPRFACAVTIRQSSRRRPQKDNRIGDLADLTFAAGPNPPKARGSTPFSESHADQLNGARLGAATRLVELQSSLGREPLDLAPMSLQQNLGFDPYTRSWYGCRGRAGRRVRARAGGRWLFGRGCAGPGCRWCRPWAGDRTAAARTQVGNDCSSPRRGTEQRGQTCSRHGRR